MSRYFFYVECYEIGKVSKPFNIYNQLFFLSYFSVSGSEPVDMHPEKRMKAAWTAFEAENLQRLKIENPTLRLSQVKQLLRKEWMKSPSNPSNQI